MNSPHGVSRRLRRLLLVGAALFAAACDGGLFVDPAPAPDAAVSLGLSMTASEPGLLESRVALDSPDRVRVQIRRAGSIVVDTLLPLQIVGAAAEVFLPLPPNLVPATLEIEVELRAGRTVILQGTRTLQLRSRQQTTTELELTPSLNPPLRPVSRVSGGIFHSCAVKTDGRAFCWGDNFYGQLGDGDGSGGIRVTPVPVAGGRTFREVHAGFVSSCGLDTENRALCWGENDRGVLGTGAAAGSRTPAPVSTEERFASLTMGGLHACGLTPDGRAFCWGYNEYGQLGTGAATDQRSPVAAAPALRFRALSAGYLHTCGVATDGRVFCWGYNEYGQLGIGSTANHAAPQQVPGVPALEALAGGGLHTCGLAADGRAFCWGYNRFGQVGDGSPEPSRAAPVQVAGAARFTRIAAGGAHTCGISAGGGQVYCWGYNGSGALGTGAFADRREPTPVVGSVVASSLDAGLHHTCVVTANGSAMCWGYNLFGQLGDRSTVRAAEPGFVFDAETPPVRSDARTPQVPDALRMLLGRGR
jgi:alpha-tubulin suppressor-like RCC1 family protein